MTDLQGQKRAEAMAARAPKEYATIKAAAEALVVRWLWASFDVHSYEHAYFEIHKYPRGKVLPGEPDPPTLAIGYGYDAQGRVVVERRQTEFPGRVNETFYMHEPDGIMSVEYDDNIPDKKWMYVTWFSVSEGRVIAKQSRSQSGVGPLTTYQYNDRGQMVRRDCRGKADLPIRRADGFVCVVLAPEAGDMAAQVNRQITAQSRKTLHRSGALRASRTSR